MHQEKYSLTWQTYSDHLKSMMKELMMNEEFADVTLVTEDKKQIKANINILSSCSPVFKDILKKEKNSRPIVYLRGIHFSEMESIMHYIYLGEATFYEERMNELFAVAKSLEIKVLYEEADAETVTVTDQTANEENDAETVTIATGNEEADAETVTKQTANEENEASPTLADEMEEQTQMAIDKPKPEPEHSIVKFECDQCDFQTTQQGEITRHIISKHEQSSTNSVTYSNDQCFNQASRQVIQNTNEGINACNASDYQAGYQSDLPEHIQTKHGISKYSCDSCSYKATTQNRLTKHILSKHEFEITAEGVITMHRKKFECKQCQKTYFSIQTLNDHIQTKHKGIKYTCDQCDNQFTHKNSLNMHIQSKHNGIKYACDQCDYEASRQDTLTRHVKSEHEGIRYSCDQCDYQTRRKSILNEHIKSKHEGVNYACDQCDYQAARQSNLIIHIQSKHEGVNYACDQCDYQTARQSNLNIHIQTKHEGLKYACDQCDYQATKQSHLARHIQTKHEGFTQNIYNQL